MMVGRRDDFGEFRNGLVASAMPSIAVGAFHEHEIRALNACRVAQDRRVVLPQVAAEYQPPLGSAFCEFEFDDS